MTKECVSDCDLLTLALHVFVCFGHKSHFPNETTCPPKNDLL